MNESTQFSYEKPGLVKTIAVLTLVNGIVNVLWGLAATAAIIPTIVLACLTVFTILPTILGVFEIIYALKLLAEPAQPVQPSQTIAILEILCILAGNLFSMIVGILALVFYNDPQVQDFFTRLNGTPVQMTPGRPTPSATPAPAIPAPQMEEIPSTPQADPAPEPEKKPRGRKVAGEVVPSSDE